MSLNKYICIFIIDKWINVLPSHLIGAGNAQSVEDREKNLRAHNHHQNVSEADEYEDGSILVHLYWCPKNRDRWHEAGCQRQGHGYCCHTPSTHQKVRGASLTTPGEGEIQPDACRHDQHQRKDHIVPRAEGCRGRCTCHPGVVKNRTWCAGGLEK